MRKLLEAAVYRKIEFGSMEEKDAYLSGGYLGRWEVSCYNSDGRIIAVIGERYNHSERLLMEEKRD